MNKIQFSLTILLLAFGQCICTESEYCLNQGVLNNDCDWYVDCLEAKYHCGSKGYPIGYGYKYCTTFLNKINDFSPQGQEWIRSTLTCLKMALKPTLTTVPALTCTQLKSTAFNSHPQCYISSGFCQLFTQQDLKQIIQTFEGLISVYDFKDFLTIQSIKQVIQVAEGCL